MWCAVRMKRIPFLLLLFFLAGCGLIAPERGEVPPLVPVSHCDRPPLADDLDRASLELAVQRSMEYYNRLPETREVRFGDRVCTVKELKESLLDFLGIVRTSDSDAQMAGKIEERFDLYRSTGREGGDVLFTGYYEPMLEGSFERTDEYRYPIYRTPDDHIAIDLGKFREKYKGERIVARMEDGRVVPYYTREDIDIKKSLEGKGLELLWLSDPVDIFFLQIQGSGVVKLPDGGLVQVSYEQSNGHPYSSIGRILVDQGKMSLEEVSLEAIKRYLREHPDEMFDILSRNESYVFFRIVEEGPVGGLDVPVTPGRTIATDPKVFPRGALAFIRLKKPVIDGAGAIVSWEPFSRFVLNQDAGGAIKGPGRVDLFCGRGRDAEIMAGQLKEEGDLYFLVKKRQPS